VSLLHSTAAAWGIALAPQQVERFERYSTLLLQANAQLNLTRITAPDEIATRHFLDSLRCALSWGEPPHRLIDIGSGAGFPGVPLKILHPEIQLTLVESTGKKAAFLRRLASDLGLDGVTVLAERAETLGRLPAHREQYDLVTARAVAELRVLAELCLPLCRVGGRFLAPKGAQPEAEVATAARAIEMLGGAQARIEPVHIPGVEPRTLVVIDKIAATPAQYPRRAGVPARRPL
jgi:16S rRNA (guanine527-N7)-methyltransferase